ncbi:sulfatase family protein [Labedella endophytica]|uniref:Sulfatase n=1 Tax=Labedella endophytica TaxID=1523160 RepID=A0A433JQ98_9MICO|nr:sulfatase-like hydrolase/transferase [Labedella endophytica]RUQ98356.1 sulfatase [Labedella endophytica]
MQEPTDGDRARPNIVIIYADDLGWGDLGSFGADDLDTPAIDELARTGVRLDNWYSNSPVCSPSRASLLTGRYPAHAGVESILGGARRTVGLPPQRSLADELRDRGYATGVFGKWHLGVDPSSSPQRFGFDEHFGFLAGCVDYYSHIFYWGENDPVHDLWEGEEEVWRNGEYLTTLIAREAAAFVERNAGAPFLCFVPFNAPHYPLHAPEEYMLQFAHLPRDRQMMAAMIKAMDDGVAHIVATLERLGLRENTVVFVSSDNGPSIEDRNWLGGEEIAYAGGSAGGLRGYKGSLFEGGVRVPGIMSWPAGLPSGSVNSSVGVMMDLVPTLLDIVDGAGAGPARGPGSSPPDHDGVSLLDALAAGSAAEDRWVFWEYEGQLSGRCGDWKIVRDACESMGVPVAEPLALYNLRDDPTERDNRADSEPERLREMLAELERWAERVEGWRDPATRR